MLSEPSAMYLFVPLGIIIALVLVLWGWHTLYTALDVYRSAKKVLASIPEKEKECGGGGLNGIDFCVMFQDMYINDGDWVIDTGNYINVNLPVMEKFAAQVKKHPIIFALFFHN